jgi:hypothetical protein
MLEADVKKASFKLHGLLLEVSFHCQAKAKDWRPTFFLDFLVMKRQSKAAWLWFLAIPFFTMRCSRTPHGHSSFKSNDEGQQIK